MKRIFDHYSFLTGKWQGEIRTLVLKHGISFDYNSAQLSTEMKTFFRSPVEDLKALYTDNAKKCFEQILEEI